MFNAKIQLFFEINVENSKHVVSCFFLERSLNYCKASEILHIRCRKYQKGSRNVAERYYKGSRNVARRYQKVVETLWKGTTKVIETLREDTRRYSSSYPCSKSLGCFFHFHC